MAGYSTLMERDEERTHGAFRLCRAAIMEVVAAHHGRIFGGAGDSVMVEFTSPVEAVRAGLEIQDRLAVQPRPYGFFTENPALGVRRAFADSPD